MMMMNIGKRRSTLFSFILIAFIIIPSTMIMEIESISAYWTPILSKVCSPNVSRNITQALFACDKLMDRQVFTICISLKQLLTFFSFSLAFHNIRRLCSKSESTDKIGKTTTA